MRDPDRLILSYAQLCEIHRTYFPDMREGQFLLNLLGWINSTKKRDPFFIESKEFLNLAKEYANANSPWYQGWDVLGGGGNEQK